MVLPTVHGAYADTIYSRLTTDKPVLDGLINVTEWKDANVYMGVGENHIFDVYLMHGEDHFYIGIRVADPTENLSDTINLFFDEGDDGGHGSGSGDGVFKANQEDWKGITGDGKLIDGYWDTKNGHSDFWYPGLGISVDFEAAIAYHIDHWEAEFKIPFQGNDGDSYDPSDLNTVPCCDSPGLLFALEENARFITYPEGADYHDPSKYLTLVFDAGPPTVSEVDSSPEQPQPGDAVTIKANVRDEDSGVEMVTLLYSIDGGSTWTSLPMSRSTGSTYTATMPGEPDGTTVQFKVEAKDNAGFTIETTTTSYGVHAPTSAIPGFPVEAILAGIAMTALVLCARKKPK